MLHTEMDERFVEIVRQRQFLSCHARCLSMMPESMGLFKEISLFFLFEMEIEEEHFCFSLSIKFVTDKNQFRNSPRNSPRETRGTRGNKMPM